MTGLFAYQLSLLVQFYGKQATNCLDRIMSKDYCKIITMQGRQKDLDELQKATRYLEIYSSILEGRDDIGVNDDSR